MGGKRVHDVRRIRGRQDQRWAAAAACQHEAAATAERPDAAPTSSAPLSRISVTSDSGTSLAPAKRSMRSAPPAMRQRRGAKAGPRSAATSTAPAATRRSPPMPPGRLT